MALCMSRNTESTHVHIMCTHFICLYYAMHTYIHTVSLYCVLRQFCGKYHTARCFNVVTV